MQTRFYSNQIWASISVACVFAIIVGCSGGNPNLTAVSGVVKANGKVIPEGDVMFYPVAGGRPALGPIGPDGSYHLTSFKKGDGVPPGSYVVTINASNLTVAGDAPVAASVEEETGSFVHRLKSTWLVPEKYSNRNTSTLTAEVIAGEPNEINFDSADFE